MTSHIIFMILSLFSSVTIFIYYHCYDKWYLYPLLIALYFACLLIIILLYSLFLVILSLTLERNKKEPRPNKFFYAIIRETSFLFLLLSRCKIHKSNLKLIPKKKYLLIMNHQSLFDPIVAFKCMKTNPLLAVTKPENLDIPIIGSWIKNAGFIPIDRNNDFEAVKSIVLASKYINENKSSVLIFPEGTRNNNDKLLDFHAGSFKIAYKSKCPIVIASIKNTKEVKNRFPFKRTHIYYKILKTFEYEEYSKINTKELANICKNMIEEDVLK